MPIKNPQTWTRLRRIELGQFANAIGNESLRQINHWPSNGEGRAIKAATEEISRYLDGPQPLKDIDLAFSTLLRACQDLEKIGKIGFFQEIIGPKAYVEKGRPNVAFGRRLTDLCLSVPTYISDYRSSLPPPPTPVERAVAAVIELTPQKRPGPVEFDLIDGTIRVVHQDAVPSAADASNVAAARTALISACASLIEELKHSNQDPRLISTIEDMTARLEAKQDIIQLGIAAVSFQMVCDRFEEEVPTATLPQLRGLSVGIGMYVSQFQDWRRFAENAALAEYSTEDVRKLFETGSHLVDELRTASDSVDPDVPRTLAFLIETIREPRRAGKKSVYAAISSIESLISVIVRSFGVMLKGIPEGIGAGTKAAAKTVSYTSLLLIAAHAAVSISPAAGRILQTNWTGKVGKIILEAFATKSGG